MGKQEEYWNACEARQVHFLGRRAREAGGSIKPGAQAPGKLQEKRAQARETGDSANRPEAVARFTGLGLLLVGANLGLAPQALCCHLLRRFHAQHT